MAKDLGIRRCWFHVDHYDIPKRKEEYIMSKCEIVNSREIVKIVRNK